MPLANIPFPSSGAALPAPASAAGASRFAMGIPIRLVQAGGSNPAGVAVLCVFIFILLGRFTDFYLGGLHIPLAISILAMAMGLFTGRLSALIDRNALLLIGMTLWMILGLPFSLWRGGSFEILNAWLKSVSAFLLVTTLVSNVDEAIRALKSVAYATLCVAFLSLFHAASYGGRFVLSAGLYSGPNELAYAAVLGIISWAFMCSQPDISPVKRVLYLAAGVFTLSLLPRTGSRAGLVATALVLLVAMFKLKPMTRIVVLVGAMLAGIAGFSSLPSDIRIRYVSMFKDVEITSAEEAFQMAGASGSSQERMSLLVDSLMVTLHRPLFGVGIGNFGVARTNADLTGGNTRNTYQGTHNTFTQISSEAGIPALILFVCLVVYCWKDIRQVERMFSGDDAEARRIRNAAFTLRLMFVAFFVFFCFGHIGYDPFHITVYGLITALHYVSLQVYARRQAAAQKPAASVAALAAAAAASAGSQGIVTTAAPPPPQPGFQPRYRFGGRLPRTS